MACMKIFTAFISIIMWSNVAFAENSTGIPKRIVSLAPSMTEIMFSLGLGDHIVADTTYCDHPEEAKAKPKIGSMSSPSLEAIVSMKPDIVIMSMDDNPREIYDRLQGLGIRCYVWTARKIIDLPQGIRELSAVLQVPEKGNELAAHIEQEIGALAAVRKKTQTERKKVLFIVWPEPLIVAGPGTAIDDALALLGMKNAASAAQTIYPRYSIEEVIRQEPEMLFIGMATGMDMRTVSQGIVKRLSSVPAVRNGAVCYVGEGLYRIGPRIVEGIKELAQCVH